MNFKVRLRNKTFWLTAIPSAVALIYTILSLFDIVPSISETVVIKLLTTLVSALGFLGVLVDPTTKGVKDSLRALSYELPNDDRVNKEKAITGETPHIESEEDDDLK